MKLRDVKFPINYNIWKTFDGWKKIRRHVKKGEKSIIKSSDGRGLFHESQTAPTHQLNSQIDDGDMIPFATLSDEFLERDWYESENFGCRD